MTNKPLFNHSLVANAVRSPAFGGRRMSRRMSRRNNSVAINYGGTNVFPNMARKLNVQVNQPKHFTMSKTSNVTHKNMRLPPVQHATVKNANRSLEHASQLVIKTPSHMEQYKASQAKMASPANKLLMRNRSTRQLNTTRRLTRPIGQRGLLFTH